MKTFSILSSSDNGCVAWCGCCRVVRIEFGNVSLRFASAEFAAFSDNINRINIEQWEETNRSACYRRKVHIQVRPTNITMVFTAAEVRELRRLLAEARAGLAVLRTGGELRSYSLN